MQEVPNNVHNGHFWAWYEAMLAKFKGEGPAYNAQDFDKILQDYSAVTDIPCVLFPEDLMSAYPNAKVILTTRPVDAWLKSLSKLQAIIDWKSMQLAAKDVAKYLDILIMAFSSWSSGNWRSSAELTTGYHRHNSHIRSLAQSRGIPFLEFRAQDGWAPLCEFLGKPVPNKPFPCINAGNALARIHYLLVVATLAMLLGRWMIRVGSVVGVVWVAWWFRHQLMVMGVQLLGWPMISAMNRAYEFVTRNLLSIIGVGIVSWLIVRWMGWRRV
ncbi:MAG: hypothetical protein Q9183_002883 [Haloplaca sp. 2 TL-2023]